MKIFDAKLDGLTKTITGLMGPVFVLWPWILIFALRNETDKSYQGLIIFLGIVLLILFIGCYLYMPKQYSIEDGKLIITRPKGNIIFNLSDIATANAVSKIDMGIVVRIMGNGGIFGYTGFFTNKTFGRMNWFVTNKEKMIVIKLKNEKHITVSPEDGIGFLKAISGR